MIKTENLTKRFGNITAVDSLNIEVIKGEIFGFLGPNGAGKTTTIKMLAGIIPPTSGTAYIGGYDIIKEPIKAKKLVGFIPDQPFLYEKLTGYEFLRFIGYLYNIDGKKLETNIELYLELFQLKDWATELIENFSHGMKQRLVMSAAFLHEPEIIIVDEPMVGLDPKGIQLVKDIFRKKEVTIFMSTHTLPIAEEICDRIAIINEGKLVAIGTMDNLREMIKEGEKRLEPLFLKITEKEII
ncbi:MAG: ABC transporter ATP-binding protein [Deltaproteobacteria bacterium]|nr:MAG: ABC transporter ATP-binding protein [Deltaproteobacteria bacterium]